MYNGPNIPKDELSLAIHFSSRRCTGGGPDSAFNFSWPIAIDVSKNKILFGNYGTANDLSTEGKATVLEFNGSGYFESMGGKSGGSTSYNLVNAAGDFTLLMWIYAEDNTERDTIFEKQGTIYASYQQELAVTLETNEAFSYYSRRFDNYDHAGTNTMTQNEFNLIGIKLSSGESTTARTGFHSKNGSAWSANYNSRSDTAIVAAQNIRIGTGYAGPVENGKLGAIYCYNKMLSDQEVLQFYNATKGLFNEINIP